MKNALFAMVLLIIFAAATTLSAANLFWDGDGVSPQAGGTGTWDTTNARFSSTSGGTVNVIWNNATNANDTAVFDSVAGTVTVGTVTANSLTFSPSPSAAYTLTG